MRKHILYLAAIIIVGFMFASCNGKGKTETEGNNSIVGKWELSGFTTKAKTSDPVATAKIIDLLAQYKGEVRGQVVEFTSDGKMKGDNEVVFYSISENKMIIKDEKGNEGNLVEFKIKGDSLFLSQHHGEDFFDEEIKKKQGIGEDVEIEEIILTTNFVRKK